MDHPFLSRRAEQRGVQGALTLLTDMQAMGKVDTTDRLCLLQRRDKDVSNPELKQILTRHFADGIGCMPKQLWTHLEQAKVECPEEASRSALESAWITLLSDSRASQDAWVPALDALSASLRPCLEEKLREVQEVEHDTGSSSYSDYSDSPSDSTSDQECDKWEEEREEEEEED